MFKLIQDIKLFLAWRNTPAHQFAEIHELCMLAARRCAHDLNHAAGEIFFASGSKEESSRYFHEKSRMWQDIFYPIENQKNYRHELHKQLSNREYQIENLCRILKENNVPEADWDKYSLNGGIPF